MNFLNTTMEKINLGKDENALPREWQTYQLEVEDMFIAALQIAADESTEDDAFNTHFAAILSVASRLTSEMQMTLRGKRTKVYGAKVDSAMVQSCCFSYASLSRVLQLIGGLDGNNLFTLTVQQLVHLVGWARDYRSTSENIYPKLFLHSKKPNLADLPSLFHGVYKELDGPVIFHAFHWVSIMVWEVHRLAQDELLMQTDQEATAWLNTTYGTKQNIHQTNSGALVTNLCEDVFSLATVHLQTLRKQLEDASNELYIMVVCIVLNRLRHKQLNARILKHQTLEICCAAANDYYRMSQRVEDLQMDVLSGAKLSKSLRGVLQEACDELVNTYVISSIYAVSMACQGVMEPIEANLSQKLFQKDWEETLTHNEVALALTRTLQDFHEDIEDFLSEEFLVQKFLASLTKAVPIFYLKCLLQVSEKHTSKLRPFFRNVPLALKRIKDDIAVMKRFFYEIDTMSTLKRICDRDFEVLITVLEIARSCHAGSEISLKDFIVILHKQMKCYPVTRFVIGDISHIFRPTVEKRAMQVVSSLHPRLKKMEQEVAERKTDDGIILELQYRPSLIAMYEKFKRKRPQV